MKALLEFAVMAIIGAAIIIVHTSLQTGVPIMQIVERIIGG